MRPTPLHSIASIARFAFGFLVLGGGVPDSHRTAISLPHSVHYSSVGIEAVLGHAHCLDSSMMLLDLRRNCATPKQSRGLEQGLMGFDNDALYPNQPLSDVACEVRFPGEMQIECNRHLFWDQIRSDYPKIMVPFAKDGHPPALQHYRFRSETGNRTVAIALNSLVYSEGKYRGHKLFIAEFVRLVELFRATYPKISKPNRVGWRYINHLTFSREGGLTPVGRLVKLIPDLPAKYVCGHEYHRFPMDWEI
jgi:hypothetical protein